MRLFHHIFRTRLTGYSTYLKYFLSYLIIVSILILSFFFIIKNQLTGRYCEQRSQQAKIQLDSISENISDDLIYLSQVDSSFKGNIKFLMSAFKTEDSYRYNTSLELKQYASTTKIIHSIIYMPRNTNEVFSTRYHVTYQDDIFYITYSSNDQKTTLAFDPAPYYGAASGQLVFLSGEDAKSLIYFPAISAHGDYVFFYMLDMNNIQMHLNDRISEELPAIALVDANKQFVVDVNSEQLLPYMDSFALEDGIYRVDPSTSICVHTGVGNGFSMIALLSNDFLTSQINDTFASTYLALLGLSVVGFFLILLAMRITYRPLHQLTRKILPDTDSRGEYIKQLDQAFCASKEQNQLLKSKLDNYRLSMQKSLLDSLLTPQFPEEASQTIRHPEESPQTARHPEEAPQTARHPEESPQTIRHLKESPQTVRHLKESPQTVRHPEESPQTAPYPEAPRVLPNIDQFFDPASNGKIFVVQMAEPPSSDKAFPVLQIQQYIQEMLPGNDACTILESKRDRAVFLINYIGTEQNKDEVLKELLETLYEEQGLLSAISNGSHSPLDIPALYENVIYASSCWPRIPVVEFRTLPPAAANLAYPYDKLDQFSALLMDYQFSAAGRVLEDLFRVIDHSLLIESKLPDFFVRCILVDILTVIINCMNQFQISFQSYSDLYYETLYLCRSCPYTEKAEEIITNTRKLLGLYEEGIAGNVNPALIRPLIEKSYCQADFSIAVMADRFHVSIAYMSHMVKKELNQNFSDYLWMLRLEKAKELLKNTDMSIDEISMAVGYFSTSGFRRKFKQETGLTPSQYRSDVQHE